MNTAEIFTTDRVVNYMLINIPHLSFTQNCVHKGPAVIILIISALIRLSWWSLQLNNPKYFACSSEIISGFLAVLIYSTITILGCTFYALEGSKKLKTLLSISTKNIHTLRHNFQTKISLNRQRLLVKYSVVGLLLYKLASSSRQLYFKEKGTEYVTEVIGLIAATVLISWIWFFILIEIVLLSILADQIQAMVACKWYYRYENLCVDIYEQLILVKNIFGLVTLSIMAENFGDILLAVWSASQPTASCIMGQYQYLMFLCFMWNISIIESWQRVRRKVRNFCGNQASSFRMLIISSCICEIALFFVG